MDVVGDDGVEVDQGGTSDFTEVQQTIQLKTSKVKVEMEVEMGMEMVVEMELTWKKFAAAMSSRMSLAWTGSSSAEPLYRYCITCNANQVKVKLILMTVISVLL